MASAEGDDRTQAVAAGSEEIVGEVRLRVPRAKRSGTYFFPPFFLLAPLLTSKLSHSDGRVDVGGNRLVVRRNCLGRVGRLFFIGVGLADEA